MESIQKVSDLYWLSRGLSKVQKQPFNAISERIEDISQGRCEGLREIIGDDELLVDVLVAGRILEIKVLERVKLPSLFDAVKKGNVAMVGFILDRSGKDMYALNELEKERKKITSSLNKVKTELDGIEGKLESSIRIFLLKKKLLKEGESIPHHFERLLEGLSESEVKSLWSDLENINALSDKERKLLEEKQAKLKGSLKDLDTKQECLLDDKAKAKALLLAVRKGYVEIVRRLLVSKAPVDFTFEATSCPRCSRGQHTLLMLAIEKGNKEIIVELLNSGANVKAPNEDSDCSPLIIALRGKDDEVVELLYHRTEKVDLEFLFTVNSRHRKLLLRLGKKDISAKLWKSLFSAAVKKFEIDELRLLWDARAGLGVPLSQVELQEKFFEVLSRPLFAISEDMKLSQLKMIKFLMDQVDGGNEILNKALWIAAQRGVEDVVELLLSKGAALNAQDEQGMTALMHASHERNSEVVSFLLDRKAECNIVDNQGRTAMMMANKDNAQVICSLLNPQTDGGQDAQIIERESPVGKVSEVEQGADIDSEDIDGNADDLPENSASWLPGVFNLRNGIVLGSFALVGSFLYKKMVTASTPVTKPVESEKVAE